MVQLAPFFPTSHGKPRVDDRRILSGIIFINRNGRRWRDVLAAYDPPKTLHNRWKRWSDMGIFTQMLEARADQCGRTDALMIGATHFKTHRTASSLRLKKGGMPPGWVREGQNELEITCGEGQFGATCAAASDGWPAQR